MGIGYLLLYAALAVVAVWLFAELLLQNRAPLLWRAVALGGFLSVVAGMYLRSVPVIGAGAAGFALGQVFVTMSVKRGQAVGWSLRHPDGSLPGPLSKVPLLSAATGGAAVAAAAVAVTTVGEVGPVEAEEPEATPFAYEELQELTPEGVYTEDPSPYYQQQVQPQPDQAYYQQVAYTDQQWQQPAYQYQYDQSYAQAQYLDPYGQPQAQPQYQDPYQDPYAAQQAQQQPQSWDYQRGVPQQPDYGYQPQPWDYQQQG